MLKSQFDESKIFELLEEGIDSKIKFGTVFLWDEYEREGDFVSIPKLLDEDSNYWRNKYLNWTYQLSNSIINGQELYKNFKSELINNESYWWQTLIADKCPYKSKSPYLIIKIWILEKLYYQGNFNKLIYRGENKILAKVLSDWIYSNNLGQFVWYDQKKSSKISKSYLISNIPPVLFGILTLFQLLYRKLRYFKKINLNQDSEITIVTYFPGIDSSKIKNGFFYSNYWGPLNDYLNASKMPINWILIYSKQQFDFRTSVKIQEKLNSRTPETGKKFLFLESNLELIRVYEILKNYFSFGFKSILIKKNLKRKFIAESSRVNFFSILEKEWNSSFWGDSAMSNYIYAASFKSLKLPKATKKILYVWENQPWEQSLLSLSKKYSYMKFIGSVHTPANASLFNLKVFPGHKYELSINPGRKIPDLICAPSKVTQETLISGGWPRENVIVTEALRYFDSLKTHSNRNVISFDNTNTLLVVTGSIYKEVENQLKILIDFENDFGNIFAKIFIKPHPLIPVENILSELGNISNVEITNLSLKELWDKSSVVFTSNSTSVGLEAYYLGLPLVICGAIGNFNLNPLFGFNNVEFINSSREFSKIIFNIKNNFMPITEKHDDIFCLNNNIPIWKNLLNND